MAIQVHCDHCGGKFRAADALQGQKAKCPRCHGVISISGPLPAKEPGQWHVQTSDGKQYPPVTKSELDGWVAEGRLDPQCLVFKEGWNHWKWAHEIYPEMALVPPPPPLPSADRGQGFRDDAGAVPKVPLKRSAVKSVRIVAVVSGALFLAVALGAVLVTFRHFLPDLVTGTGSSGKPALPPLARVGQGKDLKTIRTLISIGDYARAEKHIAEAEIRVGKSLLSANTVSERVQLIDESDSLKYYRGVCCLRSITSVPPPNLPIDELPLALRGLHEWLAEPEHQELKGLIAQEYRCAGCRLLRELGADLKNPVFFERAEVLDPSLRKTVAEDVIALGETVVAVDPKLFRTLCFVDDQMACKAREAMERRMDKLIQGGAMSQWPQCVATMSAIGCKTNLAVVERAIDRLLREVDSYNQEKWAASHQEVLAGAGSIPALLFCEPPDLDGLLQDAFLISLSDEVAAHYRMIQAEGVVVQRVAAWRTGEVGVLSIGKRKLTPSEPVWKGALSLRETCAGFQKRLRDPAACQAYLLARLVVIPDPRPFVTYVAPSGYDVLGYQYLMNERTRKRWLGAMDNLIQMRNELSRDEDVAFARALVSYRNDRDSTLDVLLRRFPNGKHRETVEYLLFLRSVWLRTWDERLGNFWCAPTAVDACLEGFEKVLAKMPSARIRQWVAEDLDMLVLACKPSPQRPLPQDELRPQFDALLRRVEEVRSRATPGASTAGVGRGSQRNTEYDVSR